MFIHLSNFQKNALILGSCRSFVLNFQKTGGFYGKVHIFPTTSRKMTVFMAGFKAK
jgi:hypothetical protein